MFKFLPIVIAACAAAGWAQTPAEVPVNPEAAAEPRLKTRTEAVQQPGSPVTPPEGDPDVWVIPAGTKIPMALRQPVSTKNAQPGDSIYAQTTFPVVIGGKMVIPAGTWIQGAVDSVKRAGRIKGTAELQFHLTHLIYSNGYTLDIAAAVSQVPGENSTKVKEPGTVQQDSEKGKDVERVLTTASQTSQIGALAGAASGSWRGFGYGGLSGAAVGTLIGLLTRGSDVSFPAGTAVEIALTHAMAVEPARVAQAAATSAPLP
jgi:type IV secretion system protein VirB10